MMTANLATVLGKIVMGGGVSRITLPQYLIYGSNTLTENFESSDPWTVSNGAKANDAVNFKTGTQSVKLTPNAGAISNLYQLGAYSIDLSNSATPINFWFYVENGANLASINIDIGQGGAFVNQLRFYCTIVDGWNYMNLRRADFTVSGSPDYNIVFDSVRFRVAANPGVQGSVSFDSLCFNRWKYPAVVITFDDSDDSVYDEAYIYMKSHNMKGTFYVVTNWVEFNADRVSWAELAEMYNYGWDIANHTQNHTDLTTLSEAECVTELQAGQTDLEAYGFTRASKHVAYPAGAHNATVLSAMATAGMLTGRTIEEINQDSQEIATFPFPDPYHINIRDSIGSGQTLATVRGYVDNVITRGEVLVLCFHVLAATSENSTTWAIANFRSLIDYIVSKKILVLTIDQLYRLNSGLVQVQMPR